MAPQKSKSEKDKGPKLYEIVIGAILSVVLGALLAVVFLAFQPVREVDRMPSEEAREKGKVYYVAGAVGTAGQYNWRPKQAAVETGRSGTLELVEQELNQWAATTFSDLEDEAYDDAGMFFVAPRSLNFRIGEEDLQIASDLDWTVFGVTQTLKAQAIGRFVDSGSGYAFEPETVYVGGLKLPEVGDLGKALYEKVFEALEPQISSDLRDGWAALASVSIDENRLILEIP